MNYRVTGRASKAEEVFLRAIDRSEAGLPPLPVFKSARLCGSAAPFINGYMKPNPVGYKKPLLGDHKPYRMSVDRLEQRLTRDCVSSPRKPLLLMPHPISDNDNERKADWPILAEALGGTLLVGANPAETSKLNLHAGWLLREVRQLTELTERVVKHNHTGSFEGFGHDSLSDLGPSPEMIVSKWIGSDVATVEGKLKRSPFISSKKIKAAWEGRTGAIVEEHWPVGDVLTDSVLGVTKREAYVDGFKGFAAQVQYLREVGDLQFDSSGRMTKFLVGTDRGRSDSWIKFGTKQRASKGTKELNRSIKDNKAMVENERAKFLLSTNYKPAMAGKIDFIAGSVASNTSGTIQVRDDVDFTPADDPDDTSKYQVRTQCLHSPVVVWQRSESENDYASERLAHYRRVMGSIPYQALEDAAMGMRLDECGDGPRNNRQASARGRDRIKIAVTNFIEYEYEVEPLLLAVAA